MNELIPEQYVWAAWSSAFLLPWIVLFLAFPGHRRAMLWASLFTAPFGLTEPLFVPEYWNPPSLFDLARRTGFDLESLIFCFAIGGVGAVLYSALTGQRLRPMSLHEAGAPRHRYHRLAVASPFLAFPVLYLFGWNSIYPGIAAMAIGTVATVLCRPDLKARTWIGGLLFLGYYTVFLVGLEATAPGYVERVWNLDALSGLGLAFMPLEELLFAVTFGMYWSGVYEHFMWRQTEHVHGRGPQATGELRARAGRTTAPAAAER
ncbi:MAG TPA: lycopene cyclase domain-containing protein [Thermoanaerobaculia bacterium]|nr:lycopene cyclase domain-containing protein [Thermoanaerobaculia bacterium]